MFIFTIISITVINNYQNFARVRRVETGCIVNLLFATGWSIFEGRLFCLKIRQSFARALFVCFHFPLSTPCVISTARADYILMIYVYAAAACIIILKRSARRVTWSIFLRIYYYYSNTVAVRRVFPNDIVMIIILLCKHCRELTRVILVVLYKRC